MLAMELLDLTMVAGPWRKMSWLLEAGGRHTVKAAKRHGGERGTGQPWAED